MKISSACFLLAACLLPSCGSGGGSTQDPPSIATAPTISDSGQPQDQTVTAGQTARFAVTAMGTAPLAYQWMRGSTVIDGATASSYTTAATTLSDSGSTFSVTVSNIAGNLTSNAATLTANPANTSDTTDPSVPTNLAATAASATRINLTWTASTDDTGVTSYDVYRDGEKIDTSTVASYIDTGLTASTSYSYRVVAKDAAGNVSGQSNPATISTPASPSSLIWQDDFEDGEPLSANYEDVSDSGMSLSVADAFNGAHSLQQIYQPGQVGAGWVIKYRVAGFPDHVFMRWYHKFEAGFQGFPPKMARMRNRDHATWTSPMEIQCWIDTSTEYGGTVNLDVKAQDSTQANSTGWLAVARSGFTFADAQNIGRWVCFEMEVQLNTPGQTNGLCRLWIDDALSVERLNVDLRGNQIYSINECMLDCYWNAGSPKVQSRFYDGFVVATSKIGVDAASH
jgi:hypothetical protein